MATHDFKLSYVGFIALLAVALAAMVFALSRRVRDRIAAYLPDTSALYWVAMLTAGTLGTALGDYCADQVGLDMSSLIWLAIWAASLAAVLRGQWVSVVSYWSPSSSCAPSAPTSATTWRGARAFISACRSARR